MSSKYPIRVESIPIVECKIDVFCKFSVPEVVAIGLIYNALQSLYQGSLRMIQLPTMNIPEEIRKNDPNLKNQATNSIVCGKDGDVQIGPYGYSIGLCLPYKGWSTHRVFAENVYKTIDSTGIVSVIHNVNLRYLDFFNTDIFNKLNLTIKFEGRKLNTLNPIFKTQIIEGEVIHILQITQGVHLVNKSLGMDADGSLIDLLSQIKSPAKDNVIHALDECHDTNKHLFFDLLKQDFLTTLKPVYSE